MDIYEEILRMERDDRLFALTYNGVAWWNLLRFTLIYDLVLSDGTAGMHPDVAVRVKKRIPPAAVVAAVRGLGHFFSRRPYDVLLHACDGKLGWYFDDDGVPFTFLRSSLRPLSAYRDDPPPKGIDNALATVAYLPKNVLAGLRRRLFGSPEVPGLRAVLEKLGRLTGKPLDFERYNRMVLGQVLVFRHYYAHYRRILRQRFKLVVTGCHYVTETFALTRAAQSLGLKVAELQHGVTGPRHAGYNFLEGNAGEIYFPDLLLSFGDYWNSVTRTPPACKTIAVGYPAFERSRKAFDGVEKEPETVVFYSQGAVSREMADFVLAFHRLDPARRVLLKLHPNECLTWKDRTPELVGSGIEVIDAPMNVHELLARYQNHVGAFSTVLYEAVAFPGNRVFAIVPFSYHYMDKMIAAGYMEPVENVSTLALKLGTPPEAGGTAQAPADMLFRPGSIANILGTISAYCGMGGRSEPHLKR